MKLFLEEKPAAYPEPENHDPQWISDLGFLVTCWSSEQTVSRSAREVKNATWPCAKCFRVGQQTLSLPDPSSKGRARTLFPFLLKEGGESAEVSKGSIACYASLVENLQQSFEDRFCSL